MASSALVVTIRSTKDIGKALGASLERGGLLLAETEHRTHPLVRIFASDDEAKRWLDSRNASAPER